MARDAAVQPSQDVSSRRRSIAELEEAAAKYGSIHERWSGLDSSPGPATQDGPESGLVSAFGAGTPGIESAAVDSSEGALEPSSRPPESFPPPPSPPHRPPFDTLIGVPRNSFAPADPQKSLRASTDALATPIAVEAGPRRSLKTLMAAAAILGALGVGAERFGLLDRALEQGSDLLASVREQQTRPGAETTREVGSLRTSTIASPPQSAGPAHVDGLTDESTRALPSVAARQTDDQLVTQGSMPSSAGQGVPKDDTKAREDALVVRGAAHRAAPREAAASKRAKAKATPSGGSATPAAKRESSAKNGSTNAGSGAPPASRADTAEAMPRVTKAAESAKEVKASAQSPKDPRRTKARSASQKPSRKSGQDGIIRQSPF